MTKAQMAYGQVSYKMGSQLFYFGITDMGNTICPRHLVAGT